MRERNWRIFSLSGTLETVRGRGVVGQEPVLSRDQPAFQYSSHVSLQAPSGHMWSALIMKFATRNTQRFVLGEPSGWRGKMDMLLTAGFLHSR